MKVITLTLAPAFDRHCYIKNFYAGSENKVEILSLDASGKGINISRALKAAGTDSLAIIVTGDENAAAYIAQIDKDGIDYKEIRLPGRIRENLTIHTDAGETRICFSGFSVDDALLDTVFDLISQY